MKKLILRVLIVGLVLLAASACGASQAELDARATQAAPDAAAASRGERIGFVSTRDGNTEIYVMNADGTDVTRLTDDPADDWFPAWSPDGTRIAFLSWSGGNVEIYVMNADGSHVTRLTDDPAKDTLLAWSPDGMRIAFESDRDGNGEIYVMNANGSDVTRLTDDLALDGLPA